MLNKSITTSPIIYSPYHRHGNPNTLKAQHDLLTTPLLVEPPKMSHVTYDQEWRKAQDLLASTLQTEPAQAERRQQRKLLATLYVKYVMVANRLAICVDQVVQPQKRALIRKLLEAVLGRILELKTDLIEADLNEWSHIGDVITELNVNSMQCEIQVPRCFLDERRKDLTYKKNLIDDVLDKLGFLEKVTCKISFLY